MNNKIFGTIQDLIIDKDDVWMISDGWKYLFKYNISKHRLETVIDFPETIGTDYNAFSQMVKVENEIYLIPLTAKDIYYCNLWEKKIYKIDISFIPLPEIKNMNALVKDRVIYCVNYFPDKVIKIETVTKKVEVFDIDISQYIDEERERLLYRSYKEPCVNCEKLYWANYSNLLIEFDIKEFRYSVQYIEGLPQENIERIEAEGFKLNDWIIGIKIFKGIMFLFSMEGKIYQYDGTIHEVQEELFGDYVKYSSMDKLTSPIFYDLVPIDNNLYFISSYKNNCIRYDGITKRFSKTLYSYTKEWEGNRRSYTFCKVINGKQILLYSYYESCFYLLDFEQDFSKRLFFKLPIIDKELVKENYSFAEHIMNYMGIKDNINILSARVLHGSDDEEMEKLTNIDIGKKIYNSMI